MKTVKLFLIAGVALSITGFAQNDPIDSRDKLAFGIKAGINNSNVYDGKGEEFDADSKFGLAGGMFVLIPIGKYLGVQPELLYSQKGFQATGVILGSPYKFTRTTDYIDAPILFSLKPSKYLSIVAGPQYSYLIKQKDVFSNATTSIEQEQEFENDNVRKNTLCATGGIDLNFEHFVFSARAGWDFQNNNGDGTTTTPRYKNVWYQATFGYRFYSNK